MFPKGMEGKQSQMAREHWKRPQWAIPIPNPSLNILLTNKKFKCWLINSLRALWVFDSNGKQEKLFMYTKNVQEFIEVFYIYFVSLRILWWKKILCGYYYYLIIMESMQPKLINSCVYKQVIFFVIVFITNESKWSQSCCSFQGLYLHNPNSVT